MKDYLIYLDEKIKHAQEDKIEEKRYVEGYLEALANVRYMVRSAIELREKEQKNEVPHE